jgi:hypothetical protein
VTGQDFSWAIRSVKMLSGSGIHESDKESDHPLTEKDAKRAYGYEV